MKRPKGQSGGNLPVAHRSSGFVKRFDIHDESCCNTRRLTSRPWMVLRFDLSDFALQDRNVLAQHARNALAKVGRS